MMNLYETRLRTLARVVREAAAFDMSIICDAICGTPACALGHYAARPDVQSNFAIGIPLRGGETIFGLVDVMTGRRIYVDDDLIVEHFGLTESECRELFDFNGCRDAGRDNKKAAAYIEDFCDRKWPKNVVQLFAEAA
jgi:hypothetical protein